MEVFALATHNQAAPALYDDATAQWWSYGDLLVAARELANDLQTSQKSLVFCFCRSDIEPVVGYLASLFANQAIALLDAELNDEFKARLIVRYQPEFILSDSEVASADYTAIRPIKNKYQVWKRQQSDSLSVHDDLAVLLSTSGSTGSPKLVRLSCQNLTSNALSIAQSLQIGNTDRAITSLPIHYSYGLSVLNSHLAAGASVTLTNESVFSTGFWNVFRQIACTSLAGVPYLYQIFNRLRIENMDLPSLNTMTQAGGKLDTDSIKKYHAMMTSRQGRFFVMYGQTEATARITVLPAESLPEKLGSVGKAIPGGELMIEREGQFITAPQQIGEVVYRGPNVMMGYAEQRQDLSLGDVNQGYLYTGDLGYLDEDGFLFITGRMKRIAKLFGQRVNLDEMETLINIDGAKAAIAAEEKIIFFCEHGDPDVFAVCRKELAAKTKLHFKAFEFRHIENLPLTPNGKMDYQELQKLI